MAPRCPSPGLGGAGLLAADEWTGLRFIGRGGSTARRCQNRRYESVGHQFVHDRHHTLLFFEYEHTWPEGKLL